jgi:hypothetical protein
LTWGARSINLWSIGKANIPDLLALARSKQEKSIT